MQKAVKGETVEGHKYLERHPDGKGGWLYRYLAGHEIEITPHEKLGIGPLKFHVLSSDDTHAKVSSRAGSDYGHEISHDALAMYKDDLEGRVVSNKTSGDPDIDAVTGGKAEFLGKGDDGLVFKSGDNVVKVSTVVPYQPTNPWYKTAQKAVDIAREQHETQQALRDLGVPGLLPERFVEHDGRGYTIKRYLDIPDKLTLEQLDAAHDTVLAMHKAGYVLNDLLQVGVDDEGKTFMFDIGKASKVDPDSMHSRFPPQDDDLYELAHLYSKNGQEYVPRGDNLERKWDARLQYALKFPPKVDAARDSLARELINMSHALRKDADEFGRLVIDQDLAEALKKLERPEQVDVAKLLEAAPAAVHAELPHAAARAVKAGARAGTLELLGAGAEGIVFTDGSSAYKVGRGIGTSRKNEADALEVLSKDPRTKDLVPHFEKYDADSDTIVRAEVAGRDGGWGSKGLWEAHQTIAKVLREHQFTAPEFKENSFVVTADGNPKLVDVGYVQPIGLRAAAALDTKIKGLRAIDFQIDPGLASDLSLDLFATYDEGAMSLDTLRAHVAKVKELAPDRKFSDLQFADRLKARASADISPLHIDAVKSVLKEYAPEFHTIGLRIVDDDPPEVGSILAESRRWEDGEPTDDILDGTSAIDLGGRDGSDVSRALDHAKGYRGKYALLLGSQSSEEGEDTDRFGRPIERVMRKPEVLARFKLKKSEGGELRDLNKAGPYMGPRGGLWEDAAHTISWKPDYVNDKRNLARIEAFARRHENSKGKLKEQRYHVDVLREHGVIVHPDVEGAEAPPAPPELTPRLFHSAPASAMSGIAKRGLRPRKGAGLFNHGGYDLHSEGKVFLSDNHYAARSWHSKIETMAEYNHGDKRGSDPAIMLRLKKVVPTEVDPVGEGDVPGSRMTDKAIPPEQLEFWHPEKKAWAPIADWHRGLRKHDSDAFEAEDEQTAHNGPSLPSEKVALASAKDAAKKEEVAKRNADAKERAAAEHARWLAERTAKQHKLNAEWQDKSADDRKAKARELLNQKRIISSMSMLTEDWREALGVDKQGEIVEKTTEKSMHIIPWGEAIRKASEGSEGERPGHKYIRRTPDGKGGWRYGYDLPGHPSDRPPRKPAGEVRLTRPQLDDLLEHGTYSIISAGRNGNDSREKDMPEDHAEFKARHERLRGELKKRKLRYTEVEGHYGSKEASFIVHHESAKPQKSNAFMVHHDSPSEFGVMRALGKQFNQDSVIHSHHGAHEMHFTTGGHAGEHHKGKGYEYKPAAEDFYTRVETPGRPSKFALEFDWDKHHAFHDAVLKALLSLEKGRKLHRRRDFRGLQVSVENQSGSIRHWYDSHAKRAGKTKMLHDYGYIRRTQGTDGDHVDVYVGPDKMAPYVFVIDQLKSPDFVHVDEQKCMLGFSNLGAAVQAYHAHYDDPRFLGQVRAVAFEDFAAFVTDPSNHGALVKSYVVQRYSPSQEPPDFEGIYGTVQTEKEVKASRRRRKALARRNSGKYAFHGAAPEKPSVRFRVREWATLRDAVETGKR